MKLTHFVKPKVTEQAEKIQQLGKALAKPTVTPPRPVVEAKKVDTRKVTDAVAGETDPKEEEREFAHKQLASSNPLFHHKLKHHD